MKLVLVRAVVLRLVGLVLVNRLGEVDPAVAVAAGIILMVMVSLPCGVGSLAVVVAVILQLLILLQLWP